MDKNFMISKAVKVNVTEVQNTEKPVDWSEPNIKLSIFLENPLAYKVKLVDLKYDVSAGDMMLRLLVTHVKSAERYCVEVPYEKPCEEVDYEMFKEMFSNLHKTQDINIKIRDEFKRLTKINGLMSVLDNLKQFSDYDSIDGIYKFINFETMFNSDIPITYGDILKNYIEDITSKLKGLTNKVGYDKLILPLLDNFDYHTQRMNSVKVDKYLVFDSTINKPILIDSELVNKVY